MAISGWLKQSTAMTVMIGPFVDDGDGNADEGGLTISAADVRLSKNGGNMAAKNDATACTHDEIGIYGCPLDATDTGTLGILSLVVHEAGALHVRHDYMVVPANVWDSLFGADRLQVHVDEMTNDIITAAAIATDAIGANEFAQAAADKVFGSGGAALAELSQAAPPATPRPDQALMLLYMALRNKLDVTSSVKEVHNDAGTVIAKKALTDDGSTYSEAEMVSGP